MKKSFGNFPGRTQIKLPLLFYLELCNFFFNSQVLSNNKSNILSSLNIFKLALAWEDFLCVSIGGFM